ncbi:hypothetical protein WG66_017036 [Moniliophthora roreri]|nr:hypothetical protein WG66_017036 [Moniliophthora roreri]
MIIQKTTQKHGHLTAEDNAANHWCHLGAELVSGNLLKGKILEALFWMNEVETWAKSLANSPAISERIHGEAFQANSLFQ